MTHHRYGDRLKKPCFFFYRDKVIRDSTTFNGAFCAFAPRLRVTFLMAVLSVVISVVLAYHVFYNTLEVTKIPLLFGTKPLNKQNSFPFVVYSILFERIFVLSRYFIYKIW